MIPMMQGLRPRRTACTHGFFRILFRRTMMTSIMTKEGRTTAAVAIRAPGRPACELPTYVARFTIIGSGVLSLTAIM